MGRPAAATVAGGVHGFPAALTSFIGRDGPMREVTGLATSREPLAVAGGGSVPAGAAVAAGSG